MKTRIVLYSSFLLCTLLALASCSREIEACFTSEASGSAVRFNSDCSIRAKEYVWDFGDGVASNASNPIHSYAESGTYEVILRTTDKNGKTATFSNMVTVGACSGAACQNGTCVNGTCGCDPGYEGPNCNIAFNEKFIGTYEGGEDCRVSFAWYPVVVTGGASAFKIRFKGLWDIASSVVVADIGNDGLTFNIPRQVIYDIYEIESVSGHINAAGTEIVLNHVIYSSTTGDQVDACWIRMSK